MTKINTKCTEDYQSNFAIAIYIRSFSQKMESGDLPKLGLSHDTLLGFFYSSVKVSLLSAWPHRGIR